MASEVQQLHPQRSALPDILPISMQNQIADTIKEEVEKTNKKIDEIAERTQDNSWAGMVDRNKEDWQTMRRKANSSPGLISNNETNMARKTVQDNKSMDMDVTKTISIANAVDKDLSSSARINTMKYTP